MQYSFTWSNSVVQRWIDRYPRATRGAFKILGISSEDVVFLLATGSPGWEELKHLVKTYGKVFERLATDPHRGISELEMMAIDNWSAKFYPGETYNPLDSSAEW